MSLPQQTTRAVECLSTVSVSSAILGWLSQTLVVVQWASYSLGAVAGALAIYKFCTERRKS